MKKKDLENKVIHIVENFYNFNYSPKEISEKKTEYYYLIDDLKELEHNCILEFKEFVLDLKKKQLLKDEQRDFLFDIVDNPFRNWKHCFSWIVYLPAISWWDRLNKNQQQIEVGLIY